MTTRPIDRDALKAKYQEERAKRLRSDGNDQYVAIEGEMARFAADPYATTVEPREGRTDEIDVAIVGGGLAGLLAAVRLRQQGVERVSIIERGADVGGTWYWNRYPRRAV